VLFTLISLFTVDQVDEKYYRLRLGERDWRGWLFNVSQPLGHIGLERTHQLSFPSSVFKAVNISEHRVAACKVIALTEQTTEKERKTVEKEMRVHAALKHENVLEFLNAVVVDLKHKQAYIPGIYMLLEFAGGGDLFDKIGMLTFVSRSEMYQELLNFFHLGI